MKHYLLRWALSCVAATLFGTTSIAALASHKVHIGPGDSVDSIARRFHASTADVVRVNHLKSKDAILRDGRLLIVPDPPKRVVRAVTIHRAGSVVGDRVIVRRGPAATFKLLTLLDNGNPIVITGKAHDWLQVKTELRGMGWIRRDHVKVGREVRVASIDRHAQSYRMSRVSHPKRERVARAAHHRKHVAVASHHSARKHEMVARVQKSRSHRYAQSARTHSAPSSNNHSSSDVVRTALTYRGVPYRFGGTSRNGIDCSGFTQRVYRNKGVEIPRTAAEQFNHLSPIKSDHMRPGDLVFFHTTRSGISHVGIYAGNGNFIHASSGGGHVKVSSLHESYYQNRFRGARRVH